MRTGERGRTREEGETPLEDTVVAMCLLARAFGMVLAFMRVRARACVALSSSALFGCCSMSHNSKAKRSRTPKWDAVDGGIKWPDVRTKEQVPSVVASGLWIIAVPLQQSWVREVQQSNHQKWKGRQR